MHALPWMQTALHLSKANGRQKKVKAIVKSQSQMIHQQKLAINQKAKGSFPNKTTFHLRQDLALNRERNKLRISPLKLKVVHQWQKLATRRAIIQAQKVNRKAKRAHCRILETLIPQAISKALAEHPQTQAQASSSGLPPVQQEQSPSPQLMQWQQPGAMWATPPFWYEALPQALPTTTTGYYGCGVGYTPPTGPPLVMPTTWTSGSHQQKCPICKKFVGAGSSALRQHQLTSSMCRAAAGECNSGREPCPYCGKMLAAGDQWARQQHAAYCPGEGQRQNNWRKNQWHSNSRWPQEPRDRRW